MDGQDLSPARIAAQQRKAEMEEAEAEESKLVNSLDQKRTCESKMSG